MLKIITQVPLPTSETDFLKQLEQYFPFYYDVKHLRSDEGDLNSQLRSESIVREGIAHQAGSDSLVTMHLYHKSINDPILKWQNLTVSGKNVIYKLGDLY